MTSMSDLRSYLGHGVLTQHKSATIVVLNAHKHTLGCNTVVQDTPTKLSFERGDQVSTISKLGKYLLKGY